MATVASIQAQIAALQAQLKQIMAQEGYDLRTPPPPTAPAEPEVAPLTEEEVALSIAQEEPAEAAYAALAEEDPDAIQFAPFEEAAAADPSMQEAVEQRLAAEPEPDPMAEPDPMEGDYETMLAEDEAEAQEEEFRYGEEPTGPDDPRYAEPAAAAPAAAEAVAVPVEEDEEALSLFSVAHGGPFDPKSEMDIGKMDTLRKLLAAQGGLGDMSDTQFALKLYRQ